MAKEDYKTVIKIEGDTKGATSGIAGVSKSLRGLLAPLTAIRVAISGVMRAMGVFYLAAEGVRLVMGAFQKLNEWMHRAENAARDLRNAFVLDGQLRAVDALCDRYKNLAKAMQDAGRAAQNASRVASAALDAQRKHVDAQLVLSEKRDIAAINPSDRDYAEKVAQVRERYSRMREGLRAARAVEDETAKLKGYRDDAYAEDIRASTYANAARDARTQEAEMRKQADLWGRLAEIGKKRQEEGLTDFIYDKATGKRESRSMISNFFKAGGDQSFMNAVRGMTPEAIVEFASKQQKSFAERADRAGATAQAMEDLSAESFDKSQTAAALAQSQELVVAAANARRDAEAASVKAAEAKKAAEEEAKRRAEEERIAAAKSEIAKQSEIAALNPSAVGFSDARAAIERTYRKRGLEARLAATGEGTPERLETEAELAQLANEERIAAAKTDAGISRQGVTLGAGSRLNAMGLGAGSGVQRVQQEMANSLKDLVRLGRDQLAALKDINSEDGGATFQ